MGGQIGWKRVVYWSSLVLLHSDAGLYIGCWHFPLQHSGFRYVRSSTTSRRVDCDESLVDQLLAVRFLRSWSFIEEPGGPNA